MTMDPLKYLTIRKRFPSAGTARRVVVRLMERSAAFCVTPYPDDEWIVEAKREHADLLNEGQDEEGS